MLSALISALIVATYTLLTVVAIIRIDALPFNSVFVLTLSINCIVELRRLVSQPRIKQLLSHQLKRIDKAIDKAIAPPLIYEERDRFNNKAHKQIKELEGKMSVKIYKEVKRTKSRLLGCYKHATPQEAYEVRIITQRFLDYLKVFMATHTDCCKQACTKQAPCAEHKLSDRLKLIDDTLTHLFDKPKLNNKDLR